MLGGTDALTLIAEVTAARSKEDLLAKMKAVSSTIGYDQVLFAIRLQLPASSLKVQATAPIQDINSGYPLEYQTLYQHHDFVRVDPTVAHCESSTEPLVWEERMYSRSGPARALLEEAQRFGLGHGLSIPVHEAGRVVSMLSLARDRPFESELEKNAVIAAGKVLATCVHVASENNILPALLEERRPELSPREMQCLQLVALGKSNWDIGSILGISETTAAFHVKKVLKKLGVSTRMQATAIGVALGLIT